MEYLKTATFIAYFILILEFNGKYKITVYHGTFDFGWLSPRAQRSILSIVSRVHRWILRKCCYNNNLCASQNNLTCHSVWFLCIEWQRPSIIFHFFLREQTADRRSIVPGAGWLTTLFAGCCLLCQIVYYKPNCPWVIEAKKVKRDLYQRVHKSPLANHIGSKSANILCLSAILEGGMFSSFQDDKLVA